MNSRNQKWIIIGVVTIGLLGLIYILYLNVRPEPTIAGLVQSPRQLRSHDDETAFAFADYSLPPMGGVHYSIWQNCGVYDEPIQTGNAIHALEHGAVWISYQPDLPANQVDRLRDRVEGSTYLLLAPYPELESPIVLTSWGVQLEVADADDDRIDQFISRYRLGPRTPEPGAACTGGIGDPIDRDVEIGVQSMESP